MRNSSLGSNVVWEEGVVFHEFDFETSKRSQNLASESTQLCVTRVLLSRNFECPVELRPNTPLKEKKLLHSKTQNHIWNVVLSDRRLLRISWKDKKTNKWFWKRWVKRGGEEYKKKILTSLAVCASEACNTGTNVLTRPSQIITTGPAVLTNACDAIVNS